MTIFCFPVQWVPWEKHSRRVPNLSNNVYVFSNRVEKLEASILRTGHIALSNSRVQIHGICQELNVECILTFEVLTAAAHTNCVLAGWPAGVAQYRAGFWEQLKGHQQTDTPAPNNPLLFLRVIFEDFTSQNSLGCH